MPAGLEVTLPEPLPGLVMLNVSVSEKVAVTDWSLDISTWQVPVVPEQPPPPDQPVKIEPAAGVAVRTTGTGWANVSAQVVPQSIPGGFEVTTPDPLPLVEIVNVLVTRYRASANWSPVVSLLPVSVEPPATIFPSGSSATASATPPFVPSGVVTMPLMPKPASSDPSAL